MPSLIFKKKRVRQPQYPVGIDQSNPITRNIAFAWNAAVPTVVNRERLATANNTTNAVSPNGKAVDCAVSQVNLEFANYQPIVTSDGSGTGDFTVMVFANPAAAGGGAIEHVLAQKNDAEGVPYAQFFLGAHAGALAAYVSGSFNFFTYNADQTEAVAAGVCDGNYHLWTGVRQATNHTLYKDGLSVATAAGTVRNISQANRYLAVGSRGNGTTDSYRDQAVYAFGWNRALTQAEIKIILDNPWQIFKPATRRIWMQDAAASGAFKGYWAIKPRRTIGSGVM